MTQPSNNARARWANTAISAMAVETGSIHEDQETLVRDLLCNLRHLCDAEGICFGDIDKGAHAVYLEEISEQPVANEEYAA